MENLKTKLIEAEDQKRQWLEQLNLSYTNLGQLLMENGGVEESFQQPILDFQKKCEENTQRYRELNDLGAALEKLKESRKELENQLALQKPSWNELYSAIGNEAFKLHKRGELQDPGYGPVFEKLYRLEGRIQDADNDLYQLRSGVRPKGIWNRLNRSIKEKTNQGKKKLAGDTMAKQFQQIGELLLGFTFFEQVFQDILPVQAKEFLGLRDEKEGAEEKLRVLKEQEEAMIEKAGVPASHITRTLKQLQQDLEKYQEELDHLFLSLGRHSWENKGIPKDMEQQKSEIRSLMESMENSEKALEEIKTSIALEQLEQSRNDWIKKQQKKEQQIAEMNRELEGINQSIQGIDNERSELEKQIKTLQAQQKKGK